MEHHHQLALSRYAIRYRRGMTRPYRGGSQEPLVFSRLHFSDFDRGSAPAVGVPTVEDNSLGRFVARCF